MVANIKKQIARNFSKHSGTYDQYAKLQKLSARCLIESIQNNISSIPEGPILEIGCGSGMLSEEIIKCLPGRELVLMDISAGMLATCKKRISNAGLNHGKIIYVERDAEKINSRREYALIVSGLTLQWFHNIPVSFEKIMESLVPGGVLLCSFLGDGSFVEWQEQCERNNILCTMNPFPDCSFVTDRIRKKVQEVSLSESTLFLSYPSVHDFFVSLKKTGTGIAVSGRSNSLSEMKKLIREWQNSLTEEVRLTCKVHYLSITK